MPGKAQNKLLERLFYLFFVLIFSLSLLPLDSTYAVDEGQEQMVSVDEGQEQVVSAGEEPEKSAESEEPQAEPEAETSEEPDRQNGYDNSISGRLWLDLQNDNDKGIYPGNGIYDEGEEYLADYPVYLYSEDDPDEVVASVRTDQDGYYEFTDLEPGVYALEVEMETVEGTDYQLPGYDMDVDETDNKFITEYNTSLGEYTIAHTEPVIIGEDTNITDMDAGMRMDRGIQTFAASSDFINGDGYGVGSSVAERPIGTNIKAAGYAKVTTGTDKGDRFSGAVYVEEGDGYVWFIANSGNVNRINTKTNEVTQYTIPANAISGDYGYQFIGGVYDGNGKIWMVPYRADKLVSINTANGTMQIESWPDNYDKPDFAFQGAILDDDGIIWMIPARAGHFLKINPKTGVREQVDVSWPGSLGKEAIKSDIDRFNGGVYVGGSIWMTSPTAVYQYNIEIGEVIQEYKYPSDVGESDKPFTGGTYDGKGNVWFMPADADVLLKVEIQTGKLETFALPVDSLTYLSRDKGSKFAGGIYDGRYIWMGSFSVLEMVVFDTVDEIMTVYDQWVDEYDRAVENVNMTLYWGGAYDGQNIWFAPNRLANNILRISPSYDLKVSASDKLVFDEKVMIDAHAKNNGYANAGLHNHDIAGMEWFRVSAADTTDYSDGEAFATGYENADLDLPSGVITNRGSSAAPGDPTKNEHTYQIEADRNGKYWIKVSYNNSPDDYIIESITIDNIFKRFTIRYNGVEKDNESNEIYPYETVEGDYGIAYDLDGKSVLWYKGADKEDPVKTVPVITVSAKQVAGWVAVEPDVATFEVNGDWSEAVHSFRYKRDVHYITEKFVDKNGRPIMDDKGTIILDNVHEVEWEGTYQGDGSSSPATEAGYICIGYMIGEDFEEARAVYGETDPTISPVNDNNTVWFMYTYASVTMKKYKEDGETPLAGVTFKLELIENGSVNDKATTYGTTDANGEYTFEQLPRGEYQITETAAPEGYSVLRESLTGITIPYSTTKEPESGEKYTYEKEIDGKKTYFYYNLTYSVVNQQSLVMPNAGVRAFLMENFIWCGAGLLMAAGYSGISLFRYRRIKRK